MEQLSSLQKFDVLARDALSARLERHRKHNQDWSIDIVYQVFGVLRQASGGLVSERDVAMVPPDLMTAVMSVGRGSDNDADTTTTSAAVTRLVDLIHSSRMILFPVGSSDNTIAILAAYVPEWKHWYVCGGGGRTPMTEDAMAHLFIQHAGLNIVAEYNHSFQFYSMGPSQSSTNNNGSYASLCSYVMLKNIKHFAYRNEFSACLTNELGSLLNEQSRVGYMHHVAELLSLG